MEGKAEEGGKGEVEKEVEGNDRNKEGVVQAVGALVAPHKPPELNLALSLG